MLNFPRRCEIFRHWLNECLEFVGDYYADRGTWHVFTFKCYCVELREIRPMLIEICDTANIKVVLDDGGNIFAD